MYTFYVDSLKKYLLSDKHEPILSEPEFNFTKEELKEVCDYFPEEEIILEVPKNFTRQRLPGIIYDFFNRIKSTYTKNDIITISLSGGPDSMVICYILAKL